MHWLEGTLGCLPWREDEYILHVELRVKWSHNVPFLLFFQTSSSNTFLRCLTLGLGWCGQKWPMPLLVLVHRNNYVPHPPFSVPILGWPWRPHDEDCMPQEERWLGPWLSTLINKPKAGSSQRVIKIKDYQKEWPIMQREDINK